MSFRTAASSTVMCGASQEAWPSVMRTSDGGGCTENDAPSVGLSFLPVLVTGLNPMLHKSVKVKTGSNESNKTVCTCV